MFIVTSWYEVQIYNCERFIKENITAISLGKMKIVCIQEPRFQVVFGFDKTDTDFENPTLMSFQGLDTLDDYPAIQEVLINNSELFEVCLKVPDFSVGQTWMHEPFQKALEAEVFKHWAESNEVKEHMETMWF